MSHFMLAVFTEEKNPDIDSIMEPFYEGLEVESYVSYTKQELIDQERERLQLYHDTTYKNWITNPEAYEKRHSDPEHIAFLKSLPEKIRCTDEEIYQKIKLDFEDDFDTDGNLLSTCNPNGHWDYFEIGGRWKNLLIQKSQERKKHCCTALASLENVGCDQAFVPDIDFCEMRKKCISSLPSYSEMIEKSIESGIHNTLRIPSSVIDYLDQASWFNTYAVITPDGNWHGLSDMDYLNVSSKTLDENDWEESYFERFLKPALKFGWYITIVDCHI